MGELDDALRASEDEAMRAERHQKLTTDHGATYLPCEVDAKARALVDDFLSRINNQVGSEAYLVVRDGVRTVHLAKPRPRSVLRLLIDESRHYQAGQRRQYQAMRSESVGPSRLFSISTPYGDTEMSWTFAFLDGKWTPVYLYLGFPVWSTGWIKLSDGDLARLKEAMVRHLQGQQH